MAAVLLLNPATEVFHEARITDMEQLSADVGLFEIEPGQGRLWFGRIPWARKHLTDDDRVRTFGFPYGLNQVAGQQTLVLRSFGRQPVAHLKQYLPPGLIGAPFGAYELSFTAPRGLSGAPLLTKGHNYAVHGVIIGDAQYSMLVHQQSDIERTDDGSRTETKTVERYESLSLGVAVDAE